jgi:tRNA-specific 2-thiouridylase
MPHHKVFVGLSGGVDSAVSAALLKEQGLNVTGVFIKIWQPEFIECTWREDRLDAVRVCAALDIPFLEIDLSNQYKKEVVDLMLRDYAKGLTPNPDVLCNRVVKFGAFSAWAKAQGAHAVATGHYARSKETNGHFDLQRARDAAKDQSYFLYTLTQTDLARTLFPIGDMEKKQVRKEAERLQLPVAKKPDSQGLCFVGEVSMRDFLMRYLPMTPGPVRTRQGTLVGEHEGAALYTIGQRHGFSTGGASKPYYVIGVDVVRNVVLVSEKREDAARRSVALEQVTWVGGKDPSFLSSLKAQARYHEEPVGAKLERHSNTYTVTFDAPHIVAPGQSLVLYDGESCVGGGIIGKETVHI